MTFLIFDGTALVDVRSFWCSPARSGPWGKDRLPPGGYRLARPVELGEGNKPYEDSQGLAWWCQLTPLFSTPRSGFGIHPDGNVPGTAGCIGLTDPDTREARDWLQQAPRPAYLIVLPHLADVLGRLR